MNKLNDTIVYLIRHAETADETGIRNTNEDSQMIMQSLLKLTFRKNKLINLEQID